MTEKEYKCSICKNTVTLVEEEEYHLIVDILSDKGKIKKGSYRFLGNRCFLTNEDLKDLTGEKKQIKRHSRKDLTMET